MPRPKGKRLTLLVATLAVVVLGVAGYALRDRLMEPYWLNVLEHGDEETKKVAAEKLAGIKSLKAIPLLIREMRRIAPLWKKERDLLNLLRIKAANRMSPDDRESFLRGEATDLLAAQALAQNWPGEALAEIGVSSIPMILEAVQSDPAMDKPEDHGNPAPRDNLENLVKLDPRLDLKDLDEPEIPGSFPYTPQSSPDPDEAFRTCCCETLVRMGDDAVPALREAFCDPQPRVFGLADCALDRLIENRVNAR